MTTAGDTTGMFEQREGEKRLARDPADMPADAGLVFIGRIRSPWVHRAECPKNMAAAREAGGGGTIEIDEPFRAGLAGLEAFSHLALLTWLSHAPRDLIVQRPRHSTEPRGVFALRSPARPNPIGLHVVKPVSLDAARGLIGLDAVDVLDGTPLLDVKPYFASTDSIPDAVSRPRGAE